MRVQAAQLVSNTELPEVLVGDFSLGDRYSALIGQRLSRLSRLAAVSRERETEMRASPAPCKSSCIFSQPFPHELITLVPGNKICHSFVHLPGRLTR